jgi:hypothetical protein
MARPLLLSIVEHGGYPNFATMYQDAGFDVATERTMRKALALIKRRRPAVVVAEFNFQSDFRDRTSSLESMMSVVQRLPDARVLVFFDKEYEHQFNRLRERHRVYRAFPFPVDEAELKRCITGLAAQAGGREAGGQ